MNTNETLLEQYRRDPSGLIQRIETAARRERAAVIRRLLAQSAEFLFGTRHSRIAAQESVPERAAGCNP